MLVCNVCLKNLVHPSVLPNHPTQPPYSYLEVWVLEGFGVALEENLLSKAQSQMGCLSKTSFYPHNLEKNNLAYLLISGEKRILLFHSIRIQDTLICERREQKRNQNKNKKKGRIIKNNYIIICELNTFPQVGVYKSYTPSLLHMYLILSNEQIWGCWESRPILVAIRSSNVVKSFRGVLRGNSCDWVRHGCQNSLHDELI